MGKTKTQPAMERPTDDQGRTPGQRRKIIWCERHKRLRTKCKARCQKKGRRAMKSTGDGKPVARSK